MPQEMQSPAPSLGTCSLTFQEAASDLRQGTRTASVPTPRAPGGEGTGSTRTHADPSLAGLLCLTDHRDPLPWLVLDLPWEGPEEDGPEASLWPATITLLALFLLSLFYSTALTVTSVRGPPGSRGGPQY